MGTATAKAFSKPSRMVDAYCILYTEGFLEGGAGFLREG